MGEVIDFQAYMKSPNIITKNLESEMMKETVAALLLKDLLVRSGYERADVYYQDHNYVVIMETSILKMMKLKLLTRFAYKRSLTGLFHHILSQTNPNTREVLSFRKWPSKKRCLKLLKEWKIEDIETTS